MKIPYSCGERAPIVSNESSLQALSRQFPLENELMAIHSEEMNRLVLDRIQQLLLEKKKLLQDHWLWPWNKVASRKHREINLKLEALGVFQGKY